MPETQNMPSRSGLSWNWASPGASAAGSWPSATRPSSGSLRPTASTTRKRAEVVLHAPHSPRATTKTTSLAGIAGQRYR